MSFRHGDQLRNTDRSYVCMWGTFLYSVFLTCKKKIVLRFLVCPLFFFSYKNMCVFVFVCNVKSIRSYQIIYSSGYGIVCQDRVATASTERGSLGFWVKPSEVIRLLARHVDTIQSMASASLVFRHELFHEVNQLSGLLNIHGVEHQCSDATD